MTDLPEVDERRCVGCEDCVVVCPAECLEMRDGLPWLPRPARCIACELCVIVCPEEAITMGSDG